MRFKVAKKRDSLMSRFGHFGKHPIARLFLVAAVLSGSVLLVAAVRAYNRAGAFSGHAMLASRALKPVPTAQKIGPGERVEVELVTVTPDGLLPTAITRPKGPFLLAVENRSGLPEVSLRLDNEEANRSTEAPAIDAVMSARTLNQKFLMDLSPGTYLLTEASHPDWVCRVTVSEK